MNFKKGYFDSNHSGRNGRFVREGYRLSSGAKDTITGESSRGTDDTYYAIKAKSGNANSTARLFGLKSVDLDALFLDRTTGFSASGVFYDAVGNYQGQLVGSYCAEGNGTDSYAVANTLIDGYPFTYAVKMIPADESGTYGIVDVAGSDSGSKNNLLLRFNDRIYLLVRNVTTYIADTDVTGSQVFFTDIPITIIVEYLNSTTVNVYVDSVTSVYNPTFSATPMTLSVDRFGILAALDSSIGTYGEDKIIWAAQFNRALSSAEKTALFADNIDRVSWNATTDSFYPLQGSLYDVVGNRDMTLAGGLDIKSTQDSFHWNFKKGFDLYVDDATGLIELPVPYKEDGTPVVTSVTGYTKQSSHPAGAWHNDAETNVVLGTNGTKDATGWQASAWIQAVDTDDIFHSGSYCNQLSYSDLESVSSEYVRMNTETNKLRNISIYDLTTPLADSFLTTLIADRLTIYMDNIHEITVDPDKFITAGLFFNFSTGNLEVYIDGSLEDTITLPVGFTLSSSSDLTIGSDEVDFTAPVTFEYLHIGDEVVHDLTEVWPTKTLGKVTDPDPNEIEDGDMSAPDTSAWTAGANTALMKLTLVPTGGTLEQSMRVRNDGGSNSNASQTCMEVGRRYRVTGQAFGIVGITSIQLKSGSDIVWEDVTTGSWVSIDATFTATDTDIVLQTNGGIATKGTFWYDLKMVEVGKTYYTIPFKTDFGAYANEATISSHVIENTPFSVVSGSFKITTDTYNSETVKVIECVSDGSFALSQNINDGTTWNFYLDTGSGYAINNQVGSTFTLTAGDKIIYANVNGNICIWKS